VGEVVTFRYPSGPDTVVTHRVASSSGDIVHTKGDANRTADPWTLHLSQVVGTQVTPLPRAGYVLVYLKQPAGLASLVTTVLGLVLLWRVFFPDEGAAASEEPRHRSPARPESAAAHPLLSGGPVG
jgi:signal peptidase